MSPMQMPDRESSAAVSQDQVLGTTVLPRRISASAVRSHRDVHAALQYRPDIDGLRGLAVGLVVAYHAFPELRSGGFISVDVFPLYPDSHHLNGANARERATFIDEIPLAPHAPAHE